MHAAVAVIVGDVRAADASTSHAIVVPTTGARDALRRTLHARAVHILDSEIVTREKLYAKLHTALPGVPPLLSGFERHVLFKKAAETAESAGHPPPFNLRPGLILEILAFYDELRRRHRTVASFDRLMTESLEPSVEIDRGAERMYRQTRFLAAAFEAFEALVASSGRIDEHALRHLLLDCDGPPPCRRITVTVADQAAGPRGLWVADFDLLARMPGLERIDIIATENVLAAGFHQRLHDLLPGIEEVREAEPSQPPVLVAPDRASPSTSAPSWFVFRDREEELADVARNVSPTTRDRTAVVFQRPLPYLYLASYVFDDADQPYQAVDALPLAAEPFPAALDLVFTFAIAEANRASTIDLLGSPHWQFPTLAGSSGSIRQRVAALDRLFRESKYLGGWDRLAAVRSTPNVADALQAALTAAEALRPLRDAPTASGQIHALLAFIRAHERPSDAGDASPTRHVRARTAVLDALESLAVAHARHDDAPLALDRLAAAVRRWIEGQTFSPWPATGSSGVSLLDAAAAAYADVDHLRIVGLVDLDWPERTRRSIFYPPALLSQLGWPAESDRLAAGRARFQDLLRLPRVQVSVSTFTLEDDAIVSSSPYLDELEASGLAVERIPAVAHESRFAHEVLASDLSAPQQLEGAAGEWLALRVSRTSADADIYHGTAGPRSPATYAVSHVERYLDCPFKYFAAQVLELDEERDDESGLTPQERGQLLHEVFEVFFTKWQARGGRAITADTLDEALDLFESVAESILMRLPETDRALERTYLLGSAVAAGLGERAFNFEIEQEVAVEERLLEHRLEGEFEFAGAEGPHRIRIRGKADRIDLLEGGTLRIVDYKLGRAPKPAKALQLPVYGVCATQHLRGRHGRTWSVSRAGYVAFKEKHAFVPLGGGSSLEQALKDGEDRLIGAIAGIERGEFPVRPEEPFLCTRCGYSGICRKDYIRDEDR
jgi:RecB family exonuclease